MVGCFLQQCRCSECLRLVNNGLSHAPGGTSRPVRVLPRWCVPTRSSNLKVTRKRGARVETPVSSRWSLAGSNSVGRPD